MQLFDALARYLGELALERRQKELDVASQLAALHETPRAPDSRGTLESTGNIGNTGNTDQEVQSRRGVGVFPPGEEEGAAPGTLGTDGPPPRPRGPRAGAAGSRR